MSNIFFSIFFRIVTLKAHAHIVGSLLHEMPLFFGRNEKKQELIANLDKLFEKLHKDRDIPQGDFPEVERMREQFQNVDFADLPKMNNEHITALNDILRHDLTELVSEINTMDPFSYSYISHGQIHLLKSTEDPPLLRPQLL